MDIARSKANRRFLIAFLGAVLVSLPVAGQWTTTGNNAYNTNTGNVGIGTGAGYIPTKLTLVGAATGPGIGEGEVMRIATSSSATWSSLHFTDNATADANMGFIAGTNASTRMFGLAINTNTPQFVMDGNGSFGFGTTSPNAKFHIRSATPTLCGGFPTCDIGTGELVRIESSSGTTSWSTLHFTDGSTADAFMGFTPGTNSSTRMYALAINSTVPGFVFTGQGRVGIGTTTPSASLDVNGSVNVTGNIAAKYQDVAEWVEATSELEPGTVVVLNPNRSNEVMASHQAYDTAVAGVVSFQPGLILGEESDTKEKIATTGRVRVRVDATRHPVRVGDLLVTSDKPGIAMYSEPVSLGGVQLHRPGTILGKALEPLPSGQSEILVLLSLQ